MTGSQPNDLTSSCCRTSTRRARRRSRRARAGPARLARGGGRPVVFTADEAVERAHAGEQVILVREETSPEDVDGMHAARASSRARGGMTSHAAVVARGWGKCCVAGRGEITSTRRRASSRSAAKKVTAGRLDLDRRHDGRGAAGSVRRSSPTASRATTKIMRWIDKSGRWACAPTPTRRRTPAGARLRRRGHRPVPDRAHVLRGRPHRRDARDDPRRDEAEPRPSRRRSRSCCPTSARTSSASSRR
jgi:phosphohistidine swiveling domain-containing protein